MSTEQNQLNAPAGSQSVEPTKLIEMLIKNFDIHEGIFGLLVEFAISTNNSDPGRRVSPGLTFAVSKIGIAPAKSPGINTVDAATVNPKP